METQAPHIVVLGAGFGGLKFCQQIALPEARITLVDRQNHHLFQPLLYQVATAGLAAPDIAQPIRSILSDRENITILLETVKDIRLKERQVVLEHKTLEYDYLVLGLGGITSYFGHPEWEQFAPGLKSLDDAIRIRREVLLAFEKAENEPDEAEHDRLMTIVVVGGGPTGVELAGAFAELARCVLCDDFRHIDPAQARVVLIEAGPALLGQFPAELGENARQKLAEMGVEVRLNTRVKNITRGVVELEGERIEAENIIWAAGVGATPLTRQLGVELDRAGRVKVLPDCSIPGFPEAFVVGDMAMLIDANGVMVPGVSPAAMQMASHVAEIIEDEVKDKPVPPEKRPAFKYWDKGSMATIGRSAAVTKVGELEVTGFPAWLMWLFVHLIFLVGFRNKVSVLFQWAYSYVTYKRGSRIVTGIVRQE